MKKLSSLLQDRGIRRAIIIDDAYDNSPRPDELDEANWANFFDDLGEAGNEFLSKLYDEYENTRPEELKASQRFVTLLWKNRQELPDFATDHLFSAFENTRGIERAELDRVVGILESFGSSSTVLNRN